MDASLKQRLVGAAVLVALLPHAVEYTMDEWFITTPALGIPNSFRVAAIPFGIVLMLVLALRAYALFLSRAGDFAPADRKILSAALGTFSGWLTLAGFLSVLLTLEKLFPALPLRSPGAALTALGSASGLALFFILRRGAGLPYGLTLLWGLLGVLAANGPSSPVFWGAAALGAALTGALILSRRG